MDPMNRVTNLLYDASNRLTAIGYAGQITVPLAKPKVSHSSILPVQCLVTVQLAQLSDCTFAIPEGQTTDPPSSWKNNYASSAPLSTFWAISCPDSNDCVAAGRANGGSGSPTPLVSVSHDSGATWTDHQLGGVGPIYGVYCINANYCIATGGLSNSTMPMIYTTQNGGATWSAANTAPRVDQGVLFLVRQVRGDPL